MHRLFLRASRDATCPEPAARPSLAFFCEVLKARQALSLGSRLGLVWNNKNIHINASLYDSNGLVFIYLSERLRSASIFVT